MGRNPHLLTHAEAADALGVSPRWLTELVHQGEVRPAVRHGKIRDALYRWVDIHALLELRSKCLDMPSVARMARQAAVVSHSVSDRLDMLCQLLGVESNRLEYSEEAMYQLYVRAYEAVTGNVIFTAEHIIGWSSILNGIDEPYLRLLEDISGCTSPWELYLELANKLAQQRDQENDTNLAFAHACLESARKSLRHVAYFYVVGRRGSRLADELFINNVATDEVIAQLYPRHVAAEHAKPHTAEGMRKLVEKQRKDNEGKTSRLDLLARYTSSKPALLP